MPLAKLYRKCVRTHALSKGVDDVRSCISKELGNDGSVEECVIKSFVDLSGYRVCLGDDVGFFPKDLNEIDVTSGLSHLRSTFLSVDMVLPPYYGMGVLFDAARDIEAHSNDPERLIAAEINLLRMFTIDSMCAMYSEVYLKRSAIEPFSDQILQSMQAYCMGMHGLAIAGIIPCIEGVVRKLGKQCGLNVEKKVDLDSLLKVFKTLKAKEFSYYMSGYTWWPKQALNPAYLDRFHERVQILESAVTYFVGSLYAHTDDFVGSTFLNRHGILHGLFDGYATPSNYLRMINLVNLLSVAASLVEGKGSLFHPSETEDSRRYAQRLKAYSITARKIQQFEEAQIAKTTATNFPLTPAASSQ